MNSKHFWIYSALHFIMNLIFIAGILNFTFSKEFIINCYII